MRVVTDDLAKRLEMLLVLQWLDEGRPEDGTVALSVSTAAVELGLEAPVFTAAIKRFDKLIGDFERTLSSSEWLAGDTYSLAEVAYTPYMIRLDNFGFTELFKQRPHATAWKNRLFERPTFQHAVAKWLNPDYLALFQEHGPAAQVKVRAILAAN